MNYYVCDYSTHRVLHGPWPSAQVVEFINSSDNPKGFCNMSRYLLAKEGVYPNNKAGNLLITFHLGAGETCPYCAGKKKVYSWFKWVACPMCKGLGSVTSEKLKEWKQATR